MSSSRADVQISDDRNHNHHTPAKSTAGLAAIARRFAQRSVRLVALSLALTAPALAQTTGRTSNGLPAGDTVSWTISAPTADNLKPGSRVSLTLNGSVLDGWHVYAVEQPSRGPIPMSVWLDKSEVAVADGEPVASAPTRLFDKSFGFDTQFYSQPFTLTVPVRIAKDAAAGPQKIPVSVQFQTCNGKTCQPPKTVQLTASVNVKAAG